MKKGLLLFLILVLFCGAANAQVEVFYLPDSGFLRVTGEVIMEPTSTSLSLLVFPAAQITELWADQLVDYRIHRGEQATIVHFALREARPQSLSFSYEGFLEPQSGQVLLGRDQLWFPEFSFPSEDPVVTIQLPVTWEFRADQVIESNQQGSFQLVTWQAEHNRYPTFQAINTTMPIIETPEIETPLVETTVVETVEQHVEDWSVPNAPKVAEDVSRVQIQIARLTNALSQRNLVDLEQLLSPTLQQEGLAHYLASLPLYYGPVTSEIVHSPDFALDEFKAIFSTERGPRYLASMTWLDKAGWMQLETFRLIPYEAEVPQEVLASVEDFLLVLQSTVRAGDRAALESLVDPDALHDAQHILDFLSGLDVEEHWTLEHLSLDPFTAMVLISNAENTRLLLSLSLIPGQYHWLIQGIQVLPLG